MLPRFKKGKLYQIAVDSMIFPSLNFIPEDLMQALMAYDMLTQFRKARERLEKIARMKAEHPNLG